MRHYIYIKMGQFDRISYVVQIMSFIGVFLTSYFIMLRYILPKIYLHMKVREWRLNVEKEVNKKNSLRVKIWSEVAIEKIYKDLNLIGNKVMQQLKNRKEKYYNLVKLHLFKADVASYDKYISKLNDILVRENILKENKN